MINCTPNDAARLRSLAREIKAIAEDPISRILRFFRLLFYSPFFFMERATRLELATSTLARWRSTG